MSWYRNTKHCVYAGMESPIIFAVNNAVINFPGNRSKEKNEIFYRYREY